MDSLPHYFDTPGQGFVPPGVNDSNSLADSLRGVLQARSRNAQLEREPNSNVTPPFNGWSMEEIGAGGSSAIMEENMFLKAFNSNTASAKPPTQLNLYQSPIQMQSAHDIPKDNHPNLEGEGGFPTGPSGGIFDALEGGPIPTSAVLRGPAIPGSEWSTAPPRLTSMAARSTSSTSGSKQEVYGGVLPAQSRGGSSVGSRRSGLSKSSINDERIKIDDNNNDDNDNDDEDDDIKYDAVTAAGMKFWKEKYPLWYQLLKRFEEVVHIREWMNPFHVITLADAYQFFNEAFAAFEEHLPTLSDNLIDSLMYLIPTLALGHQSWSQKAAVEKGIVAMQSPPPEQSRSSYGFLKGLNLSGAQIVKNKLLAVTFEDLETMQFAHRFINGLLLYPFGHGPFIGFVCDLLAGRTRLNPKKRPFCLRFFKKGRVETYVISYAVLVLHHIARQHASGNFKTDNIEFSRSEYFSKVEAIQQAVEAYVGNPRFIALLEMLYDALAYGNE